MLIKSSQWLTNSAEKIGLHFKIPAFIVGVTIVSIGTSLPEIISSIFAVLEGSPEIVTANVIGSNITNIFLILGVGAIIAKKVEISYDLLHVDLPFFVGSSFFLVLTLLDSKFTLLEGLLALSGAAIYLFYTINTRKKQESKEIKKELQDEHKGTKLNLLTVATIFFSSILIFISAKYTVQSVIEIADILGTGKEIVAIGVVALGTSLPEFAVVVNAARKGKSEMVVGSVLGSSIFNSFGVMGLASLFGELTVSSNLLSFALPIMIVATILYFFIAQEKQITKWEGWLLLIFYLFFLAEVINYS